MSLKLGGVSISKGYLGATEIIKAYLGANLVFSSGDTTSFITTWRTTTSNETITIPTTGGGYNYDISTSDAQTFTGVTGSQAITFATAGDYDVSISGDFPRININNGVDKDKLIDIKQWGNIVWSSFASSFFGCSNLVGSFTDAPNLINVTDISNSFRNCSSLSANLSTWDVSNVTSFSAAFLIFGGGATAPSTPVSGLGSWDMSSVTNIVSMLRGQTNYNEDLSSWNVSNVTNMANTFFGSTSFDQNLSSWDIANVTNFTNFAKNTTFSTSNYDAILIGWEATLQAAFPNGSGYTPSISINFGNSEYTGGGAAETARTSLINNFNWTITDGGIA
jgi:surface protein